MSDRSDYLRELRDEREAVLARPETQAAIDRLVAQRLQDLRNGADREALQTCCLHPGKFVRHHPDPSGNNDSWYACDVCGAAIP